MDKSSATDMATAAGLNLWHFRGRELLPVVQGGMGVGISAGRLAGTTYAQGGVVCPPPVCGNGMLEGDALREEECDDGNLTPGDGCSATCAHE